MMQEVNTLKGFSYTLCTVGGLVIGTSALRVLLVDGSTDNPAKKQSLRGNSLRVPSGVVPAIGDDKELELDPFELSPISKGATSVNGDAKDFEMDAFQANQVSVATASTNGGGEDLRMDPSNLNQVSVGLALTGIDDKDLETKPVSLVSIDAISPNGVFEFEDLEMDSSDLNTEDVYKLAYEEEISSGFNMTKEELHTDMLTTSSATRRRTSGLFSSSAPNANGDTGFRLRLSWQNGYYWQGKREETWWCMSCGKKGNCVQDEVLRLFPLLGAA